MVAAMAVGATAAGAYTMTNSTQKAPAETVLAADQTAIGGGAVITGSVDGMQVVTVTPAASSAVHAEEITKAAAFAQERAEREARLARPHVRDAHDAACGRRASATAGACCTAASTSPTRSAPRSWPPPTASSSTPGPTAGYGAWVKLRHSDGTVTLYGHVNTWLVSVGERVMAGDQIATMGNRGQLDRTPPALRGPAQRHRSGRSRGWLSKRGLVPRQLRWLSGQRHQRRRPS